MTRSPFAVLLCRGALAGGVAGGAAALVSLFVVGPVLRSALAIEQARPSDGPASHDEVISRSTQVLGGLVTTVVVGVVLGLVYAVVLAATRHLLPASTDFGRSLTLAAVAFGVLALLPGVKYPANPPGVGDPGTVGERTWLYASLLAAGVGTVVLVGGLARVFRRLGWSWEARLTALAATGTLVVVVVLLLWPDSPDAVPADVPAELLWRFRLASLAQLATLWAVLGFTMGLLISPRLRRDRSSPYSSRVAAPR